jgi:hypothetical protein
LGRKSVNEINLSCSENLLQSPIVKPPPIARVVPPLIARMTAIVKILSHLSAETGMQKGDIGAGRYRPGES